MGFSFVLHKIMSIPFCFVRFEIYKIFPTGIVSMIMVSKTYDKIDECHLTCRQQPLHNYVHHDVMPKFSECGSFMDFIHKISLRYI